MFHLRIGVPKDLQQHVRNPRPVRLRPTHSGGSLRTSNRAEAGTRAHEIIADWQRRFEALGAKNKPAPFVTLSRQFASAVQNI
ncbi:DUF6538 domain-containing protein [Burkholderia cepacia]|uniref:DUF6538 domain-containing protein n=1 Tax=Burkholderia cepacia TaxID=292 RepID=UPI003855C8B6